MARTKAQNIRIHLFTNQPEPRFGGGLIVNPSVAADPPNEGPGHLLVDGLDGFLLVD